MMKHKPSTGALKQNSSPWNGKFMVHHFEAFLDRNTSWKDRANNVLGFGKNSTL
jgi:hypothetical protein